ncbi:MAG: putative cofD-like protein [Lysobacterales bacterium]|jgi:uncharacterized cofD-like protein
MPNNPVKWLYPGMKVKRWLLTSLFGLIIVAIGAFLTAAEYKFISFFGFVWIICGIILIVLGMAKMIVSLLTLFLPKGERDLVNILYKKRYLERGPKIVAIGGGTGLSHLIAGLKEYTANITAVVTVADSGGSSGRLREEFNIVAPGDIRNCLVALADAPELVGELFQFRFSQDSELKGHNFGNLFLTAMYQLTDGDFERAVKETSKVLAIRGKVVPSTVCNVHLIAEYEDGTRAEGEANIPNPDITIKKLSLSEKDVKPTDDALAAIEEADIIILGPGSLYTSVIPNLLIEPLTDKISKSSAFKIYVCNVMTQHGETDSFTASGHLKAILDHVNGQKVVDSVLVNDAPVSEDLLGRYQGEESFPVKPDIEAIRELGCRVVSTDLLSTTDFVRHDSNKLNKALIKLIESNRIIKR